MLIYLDNAATTFPKPEEVYRAMDIANRNMSVNAGRGAYALAREASELISETKQLIGSLVNATAEMPIVFTPSITIAINQVLRGIRYRKGANVYISIYEHNAVARTIYDVSMDNEIKVHFLPVLDNSLEIDLEKTKAAFAINKPDVIICTHVSNVTGYILPVEEIFRLGKRYNSINIIDTAQSMGLLEIDCEKLQADFIAFAGHKTLYGPLGIGGYISTTNYSLNTILTGGTGSDSLNLEMPSNGEIRYEPGSPNIVAIAGLNAALKAIDTQNLYKVEKELTAYLVDSLKDINGIKLYIPSEKNHISVVSFSFSSMDSDVAGEIFDEDFGIAVRTGYHCAPYIHKYLGDKESMGTVRIGLGQFNTKDDIDCLIEAIMEMR